MRENLGKKDLAVTLISTIKLLFVNFKEVGGIIMRKFLVIIVLALSSSQTVDNLIAQDEGKAKSPKFYGASSQIALQHTEKLQAAQIDIASFDNGEDIVFTLDDGVYVQFADGSGRRKIIDKPAGFFLFSYSAWSLDGTRIAFAATHDDIRTADMVVANADGSNPHVILSLDFGLVVGFLTNTSWSWDNRYIMFSYVYDNIVTRSRPTDIVIVEHTGNNPIVIDGPDKNSCQFEPFTGSTRFAFTNYGNSNDLNAHLNVWSVDGSNQQIWLTGGSRAFEFAVWNTPNSIYTVGKGSPDYPNQEVLIRVDYNSGNPTYTPIAVTGENARFITPTLSPDRTQIYITELFNDTGLLTLITLDQNGLFLRAETKGIGVTPNWRQQNPVTSVGGQISQIPERFELEQNYPNPFNPQTAIRFSVPKASKVQITIYNTMGQLVRYLMDSEYPTGMHEVTWDGKNDGGDDVTTGLYLYKMQVRESIIVKKMTLLR